MPVSMLVRCEKCGYENFPQHRFCGMCAAELRLSGRGGAQPEPPPKRVPSPAVHPPVIASAKEVAPRQVSGPSFLGLGNEPADTSSVSYLLEDESPSHRGRNLILILLLVAVAAAAWHWRQDVRAVAARFLSSPPHAANAGAGDNQDPNSSSPAGSDSTSQAAPASGANAGTQVETPNPGASTKVDDQAAAPQAQTAPPSVPAGTVPSGAADSPQSPPAEASTQPRPSDSAPAAAVPKPDEPEEAASQPAPAVTPPKVRTRPAASATGVDDLEVQGEKYLYGNGVPENCARARKSLMAAAQRSNAKAQNVLGTMYATGHCATRDLPTAYRWFGRSLRQDPGNTRIEQDLKVLWNQMTPDERKLALRYER
jgi:hypothetical protein